MESFLSPIVYIMGSSEDEIFRYKYGRTSANPSFPNLKS
jgi:hypothetical protein